jgi:hypothetical protein
MFLRTLTTLLVTCLPSVVFSAPALNAAGFLRNGETAQEINSLFRTLNETDACTGKHNQAPVQRFYNLTQASLADGLRVCISGNLASCQNSKFVLEPCPDARTCFALPSVIKLGVVCSSTSWQWSFLTNCFADSRMYHRTNCLLSH